MRVGRAPDVDEPLERLLASLADSRRRIALLQDEVALYRSHTALMREALVIARTTIQSMQEKKTHRFVYNTLKRVGPITGINLGKWKAKSLHIKGTRHVSHATLEKLLLRAVSKKVRGIEGIVVEYCAGTQTNWRVCGIASGNVDAELARAAVSEAAVHLTDCMLTTDNPKI